MLLAEELLLVALDPVKGTLPLGSHEYVEIGLSGALLAELALDGCLGVEDSKLIASGPVPGEPFLAEVLAAVTKEKPQAPKRAIKHLDKPLGGVWRRLVDRQVKAGVLGEEKHLLWVAHYPVLDRAAYDEVLTRVRTAAAGDGPIDGRTAVLIALSGPCRLLERVAPERSAHPHAKARIKEAIQEAPIAPEVKRAVDELVAATAAVIMMATSVSPG